MAASTGGPRFVTRAPRNLSQRAHRRLIGVLGFFLPALLYLVAGARPTAGLESWSLLTSVSAYYYTGAEGIFIGVLFALSLFLLTYRGYEGEAADRVVGCIGGCAALGVALFPTAAPAGVCEPSWWDTWLRTVHYVSAIVLFLSFILFAMWLFRKSNIPRNQDRDPEKRWRNTVYFICGLCMILGVLWAASAILTDAPIFWPETLAITAFAVSWLVKGEADKPVRRAFLRMASREFRTSRFLAHAPEKVFQAFSSAELLASWWGPKGFTNEFEQFDFRSGGRWKFVMIGPDGSRHPNESIFASVAPAARIVLHHVSAPRFTLAVELMPVEGGTHLEWTQTFDDAAVAAAVRHIVVPANEENLDRLEAALAAGRG